MYEEYQYLIDNNTWQLIDLSFGRKPINCKWIYALKTKSDGTIDWFKERLVAERYSQKYRIDFTKTYSSTIKYDSIRLVFIIPTSHDMHIWQFNIKAPFLHCQLDQETYMKQTLGFEIF